MTVPPVAAGLMLASGSLHAAVNAIVMGATSTAMFGVASREAVFGGMALQWRPGAAAELLSILTYGIALTALSLGPVAALAALQETGTVTARLLAMATLRERVSRAGVAGIWHRRRGDADPGGIATTWP